MPDRNPVTPTGLTVGNLRLEIATRSRCRGLEDFAGRSGHLMISIKNRLFTAKLIDAFCGLCERHFAHAYVTVVDKPYIHNVMAFGHDPAESDKMLAGNRHARRGTDPPGGEGPQAISAGPRFIPVLGRSGRRGAGLDH